LAGALAIGLALAGLVTASLTLAALAIPAAVLAATLIVFGPDGVRTLAFPIGFLLLLTPLPAAVVDRLSLVSQHLAAYTAEAALHGLRVPVQREGLTLDVGAVSLEITRACNGLRFLSAAFVTGVAAAWASGRSAGRRGLIVGAAGLAGVVGNLVRVTGTAVIAWTAPAAVAGTPHLVFGKLVYLVVGGVFALAVITVLRRSDAATQAARIAPSSGNLATLTAKPGHYGQASEQQ